MLKKRKRVKLNRETVCKIKTTLMQYKTGFITSIIVGLIAHGFMMLNKIPNHDDVWLFGLGETLSSGRWGLYLLKQINICVSIPWLNGIVSVILLSLSACLILYILDIKNNIWQALLSAIFVSTTAIVDIFTYMFTSPAYMLALFLATVSIALFIKGSWILKIVSTVCLVFSLSIYQSMISMSAGLLLLFLFTQLFKRDLKLTQTIKTALSYLVMVVVSCGLYYAINLVFLRRTFTEFNEYANSSIELSPLSILLNIKNTYVLFYNSLFQGSYGVAPYKMGVIINVALFLCIILLSVFILFKLKGILKKLLFVILLLLFPLCTNAIYLFVNESVIKTRMLLSFVYIFYLIVVLAKGIINYCGFSLQNNCISKWSVNIVRILLVLTIAINLFVSNASYLYMHLRYENTFSFYTTVVTQIYSLPDYQEDTKVAVIGDTEHYLHDLGELECTKEIKGVSAIRVDIYSRNQFINNFIGADLNFASDEEIESIRETEEFKKMPVYPYSNSVKRINNTVVVKLGE